MSWYFMDEGQARGPVTAAELKRLYGTGKINARTPVRHGSQGEWRPLAEWVRKQPPPRPETSSGHRAAGGKAVSSSGNNRPPASPPPPELPPPGRESAATSAPVEKQPFQFTGKGGEYFRIWLVNICLSLVTLGVYSAWAKVRKKQYFYGNTRVAGGAFQYLADPVKILKGRFLVFALVIAHSIAAGFFPVLNLILAPLFIVALPWIVIRSLRFNAYNSALRNIRFSFRGTYMEAFKAFVLWPMLTPLTIGVLGPYTFYRQKKFIAENAGYGSTPFSFHANAKDYYALVLKFLLPAAAAICAALIAGWVFSPLVPVVIAVFYLYAFAFFAVKSSNLLYNSARLAGNAFEATMAIKDYAMIVFTNTLATVLTLGLFHPFAQVRAYRYKIGNLALLVSGSLDQFIAGQQQQISVLGDEMAEFMDLDFGF